MKAAGSGLDKGLGPVVRTIAAWSGVALPLALIGWGLIALAGAPLGEAIDGFLRGAFGGRRNAYLLTTLSRAGLIIGMAMAAWLSFRAGLFNIGGEGQLVLGGLSAALVAIHAPGPAPVAIALAFAAGMAAGAAWAMLAGVLELAAGVPLLIGSLLLNYPASFFASWVVGHPFRDVASGLPQTVLLPAERWLPNFSGTRLDVGVAFIAVVTVLVIVYGATTTHGLRARLNGQAPAFARASGLAVRRLSLQTLAASGALAGFVGALAVLGLHHRYSDGMLVQPLYAWTGIVAVLLVGLVPWAVPLAGFFFAALATGAAGMERTAAVPREIALILQACVILFVAGRTARSVPGARRDDPGS